MNLYFEQHLDDKTIFKCEKIVLSMDAKDIIKNSHTIQLLNADSYKKQYQLNMLKRLVSKYNIDNINLDDFIIHHTIKILDDSFDEDEFIKTLKCVLTIDNTGIGSILAADMKNTMEGILHNVVKDLKKNTTVLIESNNDKLLNNIKEILEKQTKK